MSPFRMARDARDLYRGFVDLLVFEEDENEDASFEIAASAREFTRDTQAAVDDKLTFSATLMRAGEVDAANRLLQEFHDDVRDKEVALIERVNEVKAAEAVRREGVTRVRLARMLAVAVVGSGLLSFSAAGMALAGLVRDRAEEFANVQVNNRKRTAGQDEAETVAARSDRKRGLRRVSIGRVRLLLSMSEIRTIRQLAGGSVDESQLEDLISYLPQQLAQKVQEAIVAVGETVEDVQETIKVAEIPDLKAERRKARKAEAKAEAEEQPTPQPSQADDDRDDDDRPDLRPDDEEESDDSDEGEEDSQGPGPDEGDDEGREEQDGGLPPLFDDGE